MASDRSEVRIWPINEAARRPLPITSPTTKATRWSSISRQSYQSPPTRSPRSPATYRAAKARPSRLGRLDGSSERCRVLAAFASSS